MAISHHADAGMDRIIAHTQKYDTNGHARPFIEPSRDDEDLGDVADIDLPPLDHIFTSMGYPSGRRRSYRR